MLNLRYNGDNLKWNFISQNKIILFFLITVKQVCNNY